MREVVDGVFELPLGYVNMHLVLTDAGVVLVDTGMPRRTPQILQALQDVRKQIGDVTTVLLTHQHPDHVGNVADLRRRSGARVVAHPADAPYVTGERKAVVRHPVLKVMTLVMGKVEPAPVDQLVGDGDSPLPGFTVVHTPGHTAGHVSYLLDRSGGVLFAGDAAAGAKDGTVGRAPKMVVADQELAAVSVRKLAGLDFTHAVFGHGGAITEAAADRFRDAAAR